MARRNTLEELVDNLRAECRISLNPAHNRQAREVQIKALQRKQEWFWEDFAWPHLRVERYLDITEGQRYYDLPEDLDITRISKLEVRFGGAYNRVQWGIDAEHYAVYDSELDVRNWPISRAKISENEQLEVWPIPDRDFDKDTLDGRIKVTGIRNLRPFVKESDRADIDGRLLVLHCAAEYKAATGAKDAQFTADQAMALYLRLRAQLMPRRVHNMFGVRSDTRRRGYPVAVYRSDK